MKAMKVGELVKLLLTFDQELPVAYDIHSEHCLLEEKDVTVASLCEPRPDGWVADKRPDKPSIEYLLLP